MKWISADQEVAKRVGIPWAEKRIDLEYPFDQKTKAIMLFDDVLLLAVTLYTDFSGGNVNMHIASDRSRKWMTKAFLRRSFSYPFEELGVRRVTGLVAASNPDALRFDLHLGFVQEGRMRAASPDGSDLLVLGMLRHECRHLREEYGQKQLATAVA